MSRKPSVGVAGQKLKVVVIIRCEYEVAELSGVADVQESLDTALDSLRQYGSAEAETSFKVAP